MQLDRPTQLLHDAYCLTALAPLLGAAARTLCTTHLQEPVKQLLMPFEVV